MTGNKVFLHGLRLRGNAVALLAVERGMCFSATAGFSAALALLHFHRAPGLARESRP